MLYIYIYIYNFVSETVKIIYTRANDASKICIAFLTVATSISTSFPVLEATITKLVFSSASGRKSFPFSSEENNPTLEEIETYACQLLKTLITHSLS